MQSYEAVVAIESTFVNVLSSIPDKDYEHEVALLEARVMF